MTGSRRRGTRTAGRIWLGIHAARDRRHGESGGEGGM